MLKCYFDITHTKNKNNTQQQYDLNMKATRQRLDSARVHE